MGWGDRRGSAWGPHGVGRMREEEVGVAGMGLGSAVALLRHWDGVHGRKGMRLMMACRWNVMHGVEGETSPNSRQSSRMAISVERNF